MRFVYSLLVIALLLVCGIAAQKAVTFAANVNTDEPAPRISLADAKKDYDAGTAIFVDSRPADSFRYDHVKGAINLPLSDGEKKWKDLPTDKKIIVDRS